MKKLMILTMAAVLIGPAMATIVFDGGAPTQWTGNTVSVNNSGTGTYWTYDDFALTSASSIIGVRVWILERSYDGAVGTWNGTLQYQIKSNTVSTSYPGSPANPLDKPGTVIASGNGTSITRTMTGEYQQTVPESKEYMYEFDLASAVSLNAGEKYWLGLHLGTTNVDYRLYWETSNTSGTHTYGSYSWTGTQTSVSRNNQDNAFQLLDTSVVPEPATMVLLGLGGLLCRKFKRA